MTPEITFERGRGDLDTAEADDARERWHRTALAAFFRAEARGFAPGAELDDWLAAERELAGRESLPEESSFQPSSPEASPRAPARKRAAAKSGSRRRKTIPALDSASGGRT